jgi:hypothetical protein
MVAVLRVLRSPTLCSYDGIKPDSGANWDPSQHILGRPPPRTQWMMRYISAMASNGDEPRGPGRGTMQGRRVVGNPGGFERLGKAVGPGRASLFAFSHMHAICYNANFCCYSRPKSIHLRSAVCLPAQRFRHHIILSFVFAAHHRCPLRFPLSRAWKRESGL